MQLIDFIENNLVLSTNINFEQTKIITVIGRARLGKSSLLNIICSHLNNIDQEIFKSTSSIKHVTQGVQCYYNEGLNLLILDSQGLDYSDSSNDHKILLFCYSISDIIIYNDRNIFNNSSLNCLCSLSSFVNRIDNITTKPILVIRIADYELDNDINEVIKITMTPQNDQYDNIRNAMKTLFSNIIGIQTNYLDKSDITNMKKHKYMQVLENNENNYLFCIRTILDLTVNIQYKKLTTKTLQQLIDNINNNNNINYHLLDIYTQISKTQILEFIVSIPKNMYDTLEVDGTQDNYNKVYIPKLLAYEQIMNEFDTKFKLLSDNIKNKYRDDIKTKLYEPLNVAMANILKLGNELKCSLLKDISNKEIIINDIGDNNECIFIDSKLVQNNNIILSIEQHYKKCCHLIRNIYNPIITEQKNIYDASIIELKDQLIKINKKINSKLKFIDSEINKISSIPITEVIMQDFDIIIDNYNSGQLVDIVISKSYYNEIIKINNKHSNYKIKIDKSIIISLEIIEDIQLPSIMKITNDVVDNIKSDTNQMNNLKQTIKMKMYEYSLRMVSTNKYTIMLESKIKEIYKKFDIDFTKMIVNAKCFRLLWIINELGNEPNIVIPIDTISKKLKNIIKHSIKEGTNIIIEYDTNAKTQTQICTYLIDMLFAELMEEKL